MTRIIAGQLRGRSLSVPDTGTRPTTDRAREAVFSAIDARVDLTGAAVLDLFAGSGAVGFEALSRGARTAWFMDSQRPALTVLRRNADMVSGALGRDGIDITIRRASLPSALEGQCPVPGGFDLVYADPPYDIAGTVDLPVLTVLGHGHWLAPEALVVWERSKRGPATRWPPGYEVDFEREYGETHVDIARFEVARDRREDRTD